LLYELQRTQDDESISKVKRRPSKAEQYHTALVFISNKKIVYA
jgi:hypothetical protein